MTQNFQNHTRFVPVFHFVALPIFLINVIWSGVRIFREFSWEGLLSLFVAVALVILALHARLFALTVQDRVIRLEMRLRLAQLLPADLRPHINDFTVAQLVSLRFAGDGELPDLARKVLAENLTERKAIKKLVKNWQADFLRA
jgi:branched-subunit amino acid transport protein